MTISGYETPHDIEGVLPYINPNSRHLFIAQLLLLKICGEWFVPFSNPKSDRANFIDSDDFTLTEATD